MALPPLPEGASKDLPPLPAGATSSAPPLPKGAKKEPSGEDHSTLYDVGVGLGTSIAEPVLGAAELLPGAVGRGAANLSNKLESAYQQSANRSPIATRAGYIPGVLATSLVPGGAAFKATEGAGLLARALGTGAGAGLGAFVSTPTGKENYGERMGEKAQTGAISAALGGALPVVPAVYKGGKKFLGEAYGALTGKAAREAEEAAARLKQAIPQTAEAGKQIIAGRAEELTKEETQRRARQEVNLKQAQRKFTDAAQAERESAAQKYSALGKPANPAKLGDDMQRRITGTKATRESTIARQAENDFGEYFQQAKGFEKSKPREDMIARLKAMSQDPNAGSPGREYAAEALNNLQKSTTAKGAEIEFRKYFQRASAPQEYKFGAEEQQAVRNVSDIIGNALDTHAPKRIKARKNYKDFSERLDSYETQKGARGVKEERNVQDRLQMAPSDYPKQYFKDRDSVRLLREQLAGDEAAVRKFANQHAVNELENKTASEAQTWLKNNQKWLDEVPGLNERVGKYVEDLSRSEAAAKLKTEQAGKLGTKKAEVVSARQNREGDIANLVESQKKQLENQVVELNTTDPQKMSGAAKKLIDTLSTMRDANNQLVVDEKVVQNLRQQMKMVEDAYGASEKAAALKRSIIIKGLSAVGFGSGVYAGAKYLGD